VAAAVVAISAILTMTGRGDGRLNCHHRIRNHACISKMNARSAIISIIFAVAVTVLACYVLACIWLFTYCSPKEFDLGIAALYVPAFASAKEGVLTFLAVLSVDLLSYSRRTTQRNILLMRIAIGTIAIIGAAAYAFLVYPSAEYHTCVPF